MEMIPPSVRNLRRKAQTDKSFGFAIASDLLPRRVNLRERLASFHGRRVRQLLPQADASKIGLIAGAARKPVKFMLPFRRSACSSNSMVLRDLSGSTKQIVPFCIAPVGVGVRARIANG